MSEQRSDYLLVLIYSPVLDSSPFGDVLSIPSTPNVGVSHRPPGSESATLRLQCCWRGVCQFLFQFVPVEPGTKSGR